MEKIVYKIGGLKRPSNSKIERLVLKLNKVPLLRNFGFIKQLVCKLFNLPLTTTFNEGFYCSAPILQVGNNVGLADTYILAYAPVIIGDNCSFSFRNMIVTSTHDLNDFSTVIAQPIIIGNNVWITTNVTILPGVVIGDNTVIGAGSVVSKSIPSGVFAAGNPCKVIREISFKK
ncbi:acyltransferase [Flavobacterium alvei]|uniref:Acetyltransferase n=1 Tax=Flavobacterium alvei TaxID=2080416 RepID=A0A2S5A741_9FLAO|nr:DapH/DapD/GlmU-related protein [Flavobacterium alvei]POY38119.1 acyltransferase [Flavobacterium alvei]